MIPVTPETAFIALLCLAALLLIRVLTPPIKVQNVGGNVHVDNSIHLRGSARVTPKPAA